MSSKRVVDKVVERVKGLKADGNYAPTVEELFVGLKDFEKPSRKDSQDFGFFFYTLRRALMKEGIPAYCVSRRFYGPIMDDGGKVIRKSFHEKPPRIKEEEEWGKQVRHCTTRGRQIAGLYLGSGGDDLVFKILAGEQHLQNGKATGTNLQKADLIVEAGHVELPSLMKTLTEAQIQVAKLRPTQVGARLLRKAAQQLAIEAKKLEKS
jgi:hypothetical protein